MKTDHLAFRIGASVAVLLLCLDLGIAVGRFAQRHGFPAWWEFDATMVALVEATGGETR